ncbi:MAG: hypothetical protein AAFY41_01805, partial [Bacteroidota bacterium]
MLSISYLAKAQVKVDATPTGKHAKALNRAKETREEAKERRAQAKRYKKRVKEQKKAKKLYQEKYDSVRSQRIDSLNRPTILSKEDSLAISKEILSQPDFPKEYQDLIFEPIEFKVDSIDTSGIDSVAFAKGEALAENTAKEYLPDELQGVEDPLDGLSNPAEGTAIPNISTPSKPTKPNPNLIKPDQAKVLFQKIDLDQFQEAQADVQKLKKKYSELPDTRFPEEGVKRNSLENAPFKDRLYFGGNLSIQSTDPIIINTNLQLGYWINKKWLGGVGVILREQFSSDTTTLVTGDGYGYSLFTRYDIAKGFFAWAELERQVNRSLFNNEQERSTTWESAYLLGIGRSFKVGFAQLQSTILYDFNYRNNDLNARPFVFRLGVSFSKKPE